MTASWEPDLLQGARLSRYHQSASFRRTSPRELGIMKALLNASRATEAGGPKDSGPRVRTGPLVVAGAVVVLAIWLLPVVGVALAVTFLLALAPFGEYLQDRVAVLFVLGFAVGALAFGPLRAPVSLTSLQIIFAGAVIALASFVLVRPKDVATVRCEPASLVVLVAITTLLALLLVPFIGAEPGQVLSGLFAGWDHSSHFAFFAGSYAQETPNYLTDDGDLAFGVSYPAAHSWIWAAAAPLLVGADPVASEDLIWPYVAFSAATTAVSLGVLVAVAADMARRLSEGSRVAASAAAMVLSVLFVAGTATQFQDHGHVNYLVAIVVGAATSWYSVRLAMSRRYPLALSLVVAGAVFLALTYPPTVAMVLLAGAWIVWDVTENRRWFRVVATAGALIAFAMLLLRWGLQLASLVDAVDDLVEATGGLPPLEVMPLVAAPVVALLLSRHAYTAEGTPLVIALIGGVVGLSGVSAIFMWRAYEGPIPVGSSYYTVKMLLGVMLLALILASVLISLWFVNYLKSHGGSGAPLTGPWLPVAWVGLVAIVAASTGYFGPRAEALPAGSPLSPGLTALQSRYSLVQTVGEGPLILQASVVLNRPGAQPILWDGGDLKNNHYLMTFRGAVGSDERALVAGFPTPFSEVAVERLRAYLLSHPEHEVQIAYWTDASAALLRPLRTEFPDQVFLRCLC